ncbi:MAG: NAD(P)-dependent oxidoreductase [Bacillota bacterium]
MALRSFSCCQNGLSLSIPPGGGCGRRGRPNSCAERGIIAGAGLDVFASEPIEAGHPFCRMNNVVLTPHVGALTEEATESVIRYVTTAVLKALDN